MGFQPCVYLCMMCFCISQASRDGNFAPTRLALHGFYPPRRGGEAGTGQDFCPDHRRRAIMGIGTDPPRLAPPAPTRTYF